MSPQAENPGSGSNLGRMSLDKQFAGDLVGTGAGEMLTVMTAVGSAVYVAVERVSGTLHGRRGSFALVHKGVATAAGQELTIDIAPDSGSEELAGIAGRLDLDIRDGQHFYTLIYTLPA